MREDINRILARTESVNFGRRKGYSRYDKINLKSDNIIEM